MLQAEIERLGDGSAAPGYLLLQLVSLQGWQVAVVARDDGEDGVKVTADKIRRLGEGNLHAEVSGASVADVAVELVERTIVAHPVVVREPWYADD